MKVFCIGDSHTWYFQLTGYHYSTFGLNAGPRLIAHPLMAASAAGFAKGPDSRFAYGSAVKVTKDVDFDQLCYNFGQVDAEAGVYYGRYVAERDESDEAFFHRIYAGYLDQCAAFADGKPYVVKGINPSCLISDNAVFTQVFNMITRRVTDMDAREKVKARIEEAGLSVASHAKLNVLANEVLRDLAAKRGVRAFDIRDDVEDPTMPGLADEMFLPETLDIHLVRSYFVMKAHYMRLSETIFD